MKKDCEIAKNVEIQFLRIIACFFVIVNHTNSVIFKSSDISVTWFISLVYFYISKVAVPIFIMISGYTLLHKEDSWSKTFKRFLRILICLILFSFVYYLNYLGTEQYPTFNILQFFTTIWNKQITTAFWYLYLYMGIILMLPFLQKVSKIMAKKDFHILFAVSLIVFGILPIIEHYFPQLKLCRYFEIPIFTTSICLMFIGEYFYRYFKKNKNVFLLSICICMFMQMFNVVATYYEYIKSNGENYLFFENRNLAPNVITAVCIFYIVFCLKDKIDSLSNSIKKSFIYIGDCTFGIYLLSDLIRAESLWIYKEISAGMYCMFAMLIYQCFVFITGLAIVSLLKLVPGIKKII